MASRDFIPSNWDAFAVWSANFETQLPNLATKYGVSAAVLLQVEKDNTWVQYWVDAKTAAKQQEKQLNDFIAGVANGNLNDPVLSNPMWALPANLPDDVPPGIKKRFREIAAGIKAQKSIYSRADGELLGIVTAEEAGLVEADYTVEIKFRSLFNYNLEADFRKFGLDAIRVEYRHKGGNWMLAAILTKSPGLFNVVPQTAGDAEQIELRAVGIKDNVPYGNYSPIFTEVIKP